MNELRLRSFCSCDDVPFSSQWNVGRIWKYRRGEAGKGEDFGAEGLVAENRNERRRENNAAKSSPSVNKSFSRTSPSEWLTSDEFIFKKFLSIPLGRVTACPRTSSKFPRNLILIFPSVARDFRQIFNKFLKVLMSKFRNIFYFLGKFYEISSSFSFCKIKFKTHA